MIERGGGEYRVALNDATALTGTASIEPLDWDEHDAQHPDVLRPTVDAVDGGASPPGWIESGLDELRPLDTISCSIRSRE